MDSHTHSAIPSGTPELLTAHADADHADLRRRAAEREVRLDVSAHRWLRAVLGVDLAGLPLLVLLTPWHWAVACAVWVVAVVAVTVVALVAQARAHTRHEQWWEQHVAGAGVDSTAEATPPHTLRPAFVAGFTPPTARAG